MFLSPIFWGCKYTNNFLFINNNIEFQHLGLLITHGHLDIPALPEGFSSAFLQAETATRHPD